MASGWGGWFGCLGSGMAPVVRVVRRHPPVVRVPAFAAILTVVMAAVPAQAVELRVAPSVLGQVREGYLSDETEAPTEIYGDFGLSRMKFGASLETYFRLEQDFGLDESETDFFTGALRAPNLPGGFDVQLGRQIVAESPLGLWDADSGQIRLAVPGTPFSLTAFGGQPRYFEPTIGPPKVSQDEQIFGLSARVAQFEGGALMVGYLQQNRSRAGDLHFVNVSGTRTFPDLPGMPSLYGNFGADVDRGNVEQVRAGMQSFVWRPNLLMNFEAGYYDPRGDQNQTIPQDDRYTDPIFQIFSVNNLLQFRGGARYSVTPTVSTYADLSYQRYEELRDSFVNGYLWSVGGIYLPGGDGLEMVQLEYYGLDSGGGSVNGGRFTYENRVYENILFRANLDVAYYDKVTNRSGTAIGSLIGVGYRLWSGLVAEVNFEANRNQLYPEDFRFGFFLTYSAGYDVSGGIDRNVVGGQGRPWPWAPAMFGPASWGASPASWGPDPSLPSSGWAAPAFAQADAQREAEKAAAEESDGATSPAAKGGA